MPLLGRITSARQARPHRGPRAKMLRLLSALNLALRRVPWLAPMPAQWLETRCIFAPARICSISSSMGRCNPRTQARAPSRKINPCGEGADLLRFGRSQVSPDIPRDNYNPAEFNYFEYAGHTLFVSNAFYNVLANNTSHNEPFISTCYNWGPATSTT